MDVLAVADSWSAVARRGTSANGPRGRAQWSTAPVRQYGRATIPTGGQRRSIESGYAVGRAELDGSGRGNPLGKPLCVWRTLDNGCRERVVDIDLDNDKVFGSCLLNLNDHSHQHDIGRGISSAGRSEYRLSRVR